MQAAPNLAANTNDARSAVITNLLNAYGAPNPIGGPSDPVLLVTAGTTSASGRGLTYLPLFKAANNTFGECSKL